MNKKTFSLFLTAICILFIGLQAHSKIEVTTNEESAGGKSATFPMYIYRDGSPKYFYPSGWMGDYGDLKLNPSDKSGPFRGTSCMKFVYTAKKMQGKGWVGIFWQNPVNNWGAIKGGYDLTGAKKLFFSARGENGGETVEFKMGGLTGGNYSDTATATLGGLKLTKEWKQYSIDLTGLDLSRIIGGFCVLLNSQASPAGCTFYVDEVYYSDQDNSEAQ